MAGLTVESRRDGAYGVVRLKGEARLEVAEPLREQGRALLTEGATRVLLDVTGLGFADSASVGMILELQKAAEAKGGGLVLFGASKRVTRMLDGMGLLTRLKLAADEAAARTLLP